MPPILKLGTHNDTLVPHQSLMRPLVVGLGTGDEKRQKTQRKNKMLPLLPVIQGFDFASLCVIAGWRSTWREGKTKTKRERRERAVWACPLFVRLSHFSINSAATHPTTGQLSTEPRLQWDLQTHMQMVQHINAEGSLHPAVFLTLLLCYKFALNFQFSKSNLLKQTTRFLIDLTDSVRQFY